MNIKVAEIIEGLVEIGAVSINVVEPFTWASGIKAPIYCDNRKAIGHYHLRHQIALSLKELIMDKFSGVELIGGTATAGIPHATSVADQLELPLVYFRSNAKAHGTKSLIEGDFKRGQRIVIVEDLISTGGSVLQCVGQARKNGLDVVGVVSIVNYGLTAAVENFAAQKVQAHTVIAFDDIYQALDLSQTERDVIDIWRKNPQNDQMWQK